MSQDDVDPGAATAVQGERVRLECERFAADWGAGRCPKIEAYLQSTPAPDWSALLRELISLETDLRREAGETPMPEEYECRFPELPDVVDSAFQQTVERRSGPGSGRAPSDAAHAPTFPHMLGPGAVLGEYKLVAALGRGGMGEVFRALHLRLERAVALKVIAPGRLADPAIAGRFARELRAIGRLDHPNLVRATDAGQHGPWHFLVMDLLEGFDLKQLVERLGPLPAAEAAELIRQAAEGLQYAHDRGIVHRDLKPSNLMLTTGGTVKVLDLGLARLVDPAGTGEDDGLSSSGHLMGTPDYMAPEQCLDPRAVSPRSDLYSLGCTLYQLLAARPPFHDTNSSFEKMQAHRAVPVPPIGRFRPDVPASLVALLDRLLTKDPAARPESASAVAEALQPLALGADLAGLLERARLARGPAAALANAPTAGAEPTEGEADAAGDPPWSSIKGSIARAKAHELAPAEWPPTRRPLLISTGLAAAASLFLGLAALWYARPKPPEFAPKSAPSPPSAPTPIRLNPLRIKMSVHLYRPTRIELVDLGVIGHSVFHAVEHDRARVVVEFSEPAYAYLLALNPNGEVQPVLPEMPVTRPGRTLRLELYNEPAAYFELTDGEGVQAFLAVASKSTLPAYEQWSSGHRLSWQHIPSHSASALYFGGHEFVPLVRSLVAAPRNEPEVRGIKTFAVPEILDRACRAAKAWPGVDGVTAVAFPVEPAAGGSKPN